MIASSLNNG
jgi:hypothetical protein